MQQGTILWHISRHIIYLLFTSEQLLVHYYLVQIHFEHCEQRMLYLCITSAKVSIRTSNWSGYIFCLICVDFVSLFLHVHVRFATNWLNSHIGWHIYVAMITTVKMSKKYIFWFPIYSIFDFNEIPVLLVR